MKKNHLFATLLTAILLPAHAEPIPLAPHKLTSEQQEAAQKGTQLYMWGSDTTSHILKSGRARMLQDGKFCIVEGSLPLEKQDAQGKLIPTQGEYRIALIYRIIGKYWREVGLVSKRYAEQQRFLYEIVGQELFIYSAKGEELKSISLTITEPKQAPLSTQKNLPQKLQKEVNEIPLSKMIDLKQAQYCFIEKGQYLLIFTNNDLNRLISVFKYTTSSSTPQQRKLKLVEISYGMALNPSAQGDKSLTFYYINNRLFALNALGDEVYSIQLPTTTTQS